MVFQSIYSVVTSPLPQFQEALKEIINEKFASLVLCSLCTFLRFLRFLYANFEIQVNSNILVIFTVMLEPKNKKYQV